jgi:hypothetical protein
VVGSIVGLSALSPGGFVHLSSLDRDPVWRVAGAVSFGIAVVCYGGKAISCAFRTASDHRNQKDTLVARVTAFASAYAALASVIILDTVVESRGLLKSASIGALAGSLGGAAHPSAQGSPWGLYCAAALLSTGYGCYQAYAGWRSLSPAVVNRLSLAKEEDERAIVAVSFTPELCSALGTVRCCERTLAQVEEDASRISADFAQRRSSLESRRREVSEDLTDHEAKLLHQHIAQVRGASAEADKRFRALRSRRNWGIWRSRKGAVR